MLPAMRDLINEVDASLAGHPFTLVRPNLSSRLSITDQDDDILQDHAQETGRNWMPSRMLHLAPNLLGGSSYGPGTDNVLPSFTESFSSRSPDISFSTSLVSLVDLLVDTPTHSVTLEPHAPESLADVYACVPGHWSNAPAGVWHHLANRFDEVAHTTTRDDNRGHAQELAERMRAIAYGAEMIPRTPVDEGMDISDGDRSMEDQSGMIERGGEMSQHDEMVDQVGGPSLLPLEFGGIWSMASPTSTVNSTLPTFMFGNDLPDAPYVQGIPEARFFAPKACKTRECWQNVIGRLDEAAASCLWR